MSGNHRSHWATSPAAYAVREAGSGGRYTGRSSRTRSLSTVNRPGPADPLGDHRGRHRRPGRQQLPDARLDRIHDRPAAQRRSYRGGPVAASARFTVFFEHPITLAIALIGIPSARCSRRISAQSSTPNTSLPPRLGSSQGPRGVSFQASIGGQFSRVVDTWQAHQPSEHVRALPSSVRLGSPRAWSTSGPRRRLLSRVGNVSLAQSFC